MLPNNLYTEFAWVKPVQVLYEESIYIASFTQKTEGAKLFKVALLGTLFLSPTFCKI